MKLGIFGDSYADVNGDHDLKSWPNLLAKKTDFCEITSMCGTSHYWAYSHFVEANRQHDFTHIIFCHTNPFRWPCLPEELEGQNWNIHSTDNASYDEKLGFLNKYYLDLFPEDLSCFISNSIFKDVNAYCEQNNIFLINITCFFDQNIKETKFPLLIDLDSVSHIEKIRYKNDEYTFRQIDQKFNIENGDPRICHLGDLNNKRLSTILYSLLIDKPNNISYNILKDFDWDIYDPSNDILFEKTIGN